MIAYLSAHNYYLYTTDFALHGWVYGWVEFYNLFSDEFEWPLGTNENKQNILEFFSLKGIPGSFFTSSIENQVVENS